MPAKHIPMGEPVHDAERQAICYVVDGLPDDYTVYSNAWIVERSGVVYETDLVVAAPHAIYIVEVKSYRGLIEGNDHDWRIPAPIRSPLKLNRKTAQILASNLRRRSYDAGRVWVEGFVFLSHTVDVKIDGRASEFRVHTRKTLLDALQDERLITQRLSRGPAVPVDGHAQDVLHRLITGADRSHRPPRRIRNYLLESTLDRTDHYVEHLAKNELTGTHAVLRVYTIPPLADPERRRTIERRFRWEAQVLAKVGRHQHVLQASEPFLDEAGMCLPFEHFDGVSLTSWLETHEKALEGKASLEARVTLWKKIVDAIGYAHQQGVIHRLLRPEIILVEDRGLDTDHPGDPDKQPRVRVTGFDLAKQASAGSSTIGMTTAQKDRLQWGAPEEIRNFSDATEASDQFGLGALLGLILAGKPLFDSTLEYQRRGQVVTRLRDMNPYVPHSLDEAVATMIKIRPAERYPSLDDAVAAVDEAVSPRRRARRADAAPSAPSLEPEDLKEGTRLGTDYEILGRLGDGGLSTVYTARHLVSGRTRALKVARPDESAEETLLHEYEVLKRLDHDNIVKAIDVTNVVPERRTLVLERVKGQTLATYAYQATDPDPAVLRRFAEDLHNALVYMEREEVVHKDLKPDNLIVGDGGLTVIDFSLVDAPPDRSDVGTALYRDPALAVWDHQADRYAAALCLFELYEGRHAFDGKAPEPDAHPDFAEDELAFPTLAPFFNKALHPTRDRRFPSALAMREAFRQSLGKPDTTPTAETEAQVDPTLSPDTALTATLLDSTAVASLRRAGIYTQGELLALDDSQIRAIKSLGNKRRKAVLDFRRALLDRGATAEAADAIHAPRLMLALTGDTTPLPRLGLPTTLADTLQAAGFATVGSVAEATRTDLMAIEGVGAKTIAHVAAALHRYHERRDDTAPIRSLEDLWQQALRPLAQEETQVLAGLLGNGCPPRTQKQLTADLGVQQPTVSRRMNSALETLDKDALTEVFTLVDTLVDQSGGIARMDEAIRQLEELHPAREETTTGALIRLVVRLYNTRLHLVPQHLSGGDELVARPWFDAETLDAFSEEANRLARAWPLTSETARRSLRDFLPDYELNHLALAERIVPDVRLNASGELYVPPLYPRDYLRVILSRERLPIHLDDLRNVVEDTFGEGATWPEPDEIARLFGETGELSEFRLEGDRIVAAESGSVRARRTAQDPLPDELLVAAPEQVVANHLRTALEGHRGFRMLVTPPEKHQDIGPSVARALGPDATFLSFEHLLLERIDERFKSFEKAERFKAQRKKLTREAEALLDDLIHDHGRPGQAIVLGDTAILELCDALHLVRTLYDRTQSGAEGFWSLVIPGVVHQRQPHFNERTPVFHLPGAMLPLPDVIPPAEAA